MQKIFRIARLELSLLFYSPIAWLILIIFTVQSGLVFTDMLYSQETQQQLGRPLNVLSKVLFAGDTGLFKAVQDNLYLYIPLLTMGLMSREISSGSIKLLYSSPVTLFQIVLGKYLAMMLYGLLFVGILLLYMGAAMVSVEALEVCFVLGGILGLYLLVCAYAAIGLFMSSLTGYQVVAAISTLAVLACLNFIGQVGQNYDVLREITYWLSMTGRTESFINGPLTSRDALYFVFVVFLFLSLTIMRLGNERSLRSVPMKWLRYGLLIAGVIGVIYLTSMPRWTAYYDTTRFNDRTLSVNSQQLLKRLDEPITITTYTNIIDRFASYGAPKNRMADRGRFENYKRFLPDMKMVYVPYYDTLTYRIDATKTLEEKAKQAADVLGFDFEQVLTPQQVKERVDLAPEENRMVRFLEYKGKKMPLRMFDDIFVYPGEAETSVAIKQLLDPSAQIGILSGHGERSIGKVGDDAYKAIVNGVGQRQSLINQGFVTRAISADQPIPTDLTALIIADPKTPYADQQIGHIIKDYIEAGGNVLIAGEPGGQTLLNPILEMFGIAYPSGTLLQESENYDLDLIQATFTPEAASMGFGFYEGAIVGLPNATAIEQVADKGFEVTPLLVTNGKKTWNRRGAFDLAVDQVAFNPDLEKKLAMPVGVSLTRQHAGKEQKILVLGDADFMSNSELNRFNLNTVNTAFAIRIFKWFSNGEYPFSNERPRAIDTRIRVSRSQINWQKGIFFGIIPAIILVVGTTLLLRRRRN